MISKRKQRILDAKARDKCETAKLREFERAQPKPSQFRKFKISWDKRTLQELARKRGEIKTKGGK